MLAFEEDDEEVTYWDHWDIKPSDEKLYDINSSWCKVLSHLGQGLDPFVSNSEQANCGQVWLTMWIAKLLSNPYTKLPYLYLYGPRDSGRSILGYALEHIMGKKCFIGYSGWMSGNSLWNYEIADRNLIVIDEYAVHKLSLIKMVNAKERLIHEPMKWPTMRPNNSNFIQTGNGDDWLDIKYKHGFVGVKCEPVERPMHIGTLSKQLVSDAPAFMDYCSKLPLPETLLPI